MTRPSELRDLPDDELEHRLSERRQELFNLRFQAVTGALENTARLKLTKREIARILTVVTERAAIEEGSRWLTRETENTRARDRGTGG